MKLIVTYKLRSSIAAEFLRELSLLGIPELVRAENGCMRYDYYLPADGSADCVILVEEWQTAELQAFHMEQPHMKRLAEIKIRYVSSTTVDIIAEQPTSALS